MLPVLIGILSSLGTDVAVVRTVVVLGTLLYQFVNLLTDVLYALLDPSGADGEVSPTFLLAFAEREAACAGA